MVLIVDASIDIEESYFEKFSKVIPIYIINPRKNLKIKVDLENRYILYEDKELYEDYKKGFLKTAIPSKEEIAKILDKKNSGLIITLSSKLSNLYSTVKKIIEEYNYNYELIDSKQASVGYGMFIKEFFKNKENIRVETFGYIHNKAFKILLNSGRINPIKYAFLRVTNLNAKFKVEDGEAKLYSLFRGDLYKELKKDLEKIEGDYLVGYSKEMENLGIKNKVLINSLVVINLGSPVLALSFTQHSL